MKLNQRPLQPRARAGKTNESAAAQFRRAFQIEQLQLRPERDVIQHWSRRIPVFLPNCAPPDSRSHLSRSARSRAAGSEFREADSRCCSSDRGRLLVEQRNLVADLAGRALPIRPDDLAATALAADFLAQAFAVGVALLQRGLRFRRSASTCSTSSILRRIVAATGREPAFHKVGLFANQADIEHGRQV